MGKLRDGSMARRKLVVVRFSDSEFEKIESMMAADGARNKSEFIRAIVTEKSEGGSGPLAAVLAKIERRLEDLGGVKPREVSSEAL